MNPRKVMIVVGSPRKEGNSTVLARKLSDGATSVGADVEMFHLHDMNIRPCNACDSCQKDSSEGCVIDDDMQTIHTKLRQADTLVIASPIYTFTVTAQTKLFMDRCRPLWQSHSNIFQGMPIGILLTYAASDPYNSGAVNAIRTFQDLCKYLGAHIAGMVYGSASKPGEIKNNRELMDKAYALGRHLGAV